MSDRSVTFFSIMCSHVFSKIQFVRTLDRQTLWALLLFVILIAMWHAGITRVGDDIFFGEVQNYSFDFYKNRYLRWSSRIFIEMVLVPIAGLPLMVFGILNTLVVLSLPFLLARLVVPRTEMKNILFPAICLMLMYPLAHMREAGWIATCINYLWPLATALLAVMPFRKLYDGLHVSTAGYIFSLLSLLFACNNELVCAVLLIIIPVYICVMGRKCPRIVWLYVALVAASLAQILLCPGNALRLNAEVVTWMPQFYAMSLLQKLYHGYMSMVVPLFFHTNYVLLGLSVVLCFGVFQRTAALPFHISTVIPLLVVLIVVPGSIGEQALLITVWKQYELFVISFIVITSLSISLYLLARSVRDYCVVMALLVGAFCARGAMAFSPTMFASESRTVLVVYVALILAALWAYARIRETLSATLLALCHALFAAFAAFSTLYTTYNLYFHHRYA